MNALFTAAPPRAPTTGSACAATFWVTTNPKRAATWVTNLRRIGAPSLMTPRSATNRAASVTVFASMPRTAKYPLSDASADPARPPKAKTSTQDRAASGSHRSSPSFCAMSAIDRNIITVDTGNSTGSAATPNVPPAAPDAVARARCNNSDPVRGDRGRVRNSTFSAASRPMDVADAIAFEANEGSAYPISSTGLPIRFVSRAARLGCSRDLTAFVRASRSAIVMSEVSSNDNVSSGVITTHYCKNLPKHNFRPEHLQERQAGSSSQACSYLFAMILDARCSKGKNDFERGRMPSQFASTQLIFRSQSCFGF